MEKTNIALLIFIGIIVIYVSILRSLWEKGDRAGENLAKIRMIPLFAALCVLCKLTFWDFVIASMMFLLIIADVFKKVWIIIAVVFYGLCFAAFFLHISWWWLYGCLIVFTVISLFLWLRKFYKRFLRFENP